MTVETGRSPVEGARIDGEAVNGKQRLLQAALELFADQGYDGASVRDITERAGVSVGLVSKHFGSKAGLRAAVDASVFELLASPYERLRDADPIAVLKTFSVGQWTEDVDLDRRWIHICLAYLRRCLLEQSEASVDTVRKMYEQRLNQVLAWKEEGRLRDDADVDDIVELLVSSALGVLAFQPLLQAALGPEFSESAMIERRARFFGQLMERALVRKDA